MTDMTSPAAEGLGTFERWLSVWVALAIGAGLLLGNLMPGLFGWLAGLEVASVNLPVAVLIWAMVYPMMVGVDFGSLARVGEKPKGLIITLVVNWLIKPFTMAALGVLFFEYVFAGLIPADDAQAYLAGVILLGAAPCTAMVFVWSNLTRGDATYTLVQVSVNDVIMVFAFAPIVAFLLGVTDQAGARRGRSPCRPVQIPCAAVLDPRPADHCGAAVRLSGGGHPRPALGHCPDRGAAADPVLWHLPTGLWRGAGLGHSVQCGRALRADRHVEFL